MVLLEMGSDPPYLVQAVHPHLDDPFWYSFYPILVVLSIKYRRQDLGDLSWQDLAPCEAGDEFVGLIGCVARVAHGGRRLGRRGWERDSRST